MASWNTIEKLLLAQAIYRFAENWQHVSRALRSHPTLMQQNLRPEDIRPSNFYSQKNCALQWSRMLEQLEGARRNKRSVDANSDATPVVKLARTLYMQLVEELKESINLAESQYRELTNQIRDISAGLMDDRLQEVLKKWGLDPEATQVAAEAASAYAAAMASSEIDDVDDMLDLSGMIDASTEPTLATSDEPSAVKPTEESGFEGGEESLPANDSVDPTTDDGGEQSIADHVTESIEESLDVNQEDQPKPAHLEPSSPTTYDTETADGPTIDTATHAMDEAIAEEVSNPSAAFEEIDTTPSSEPAHENVQLFSTDNQQEEDDDPMKLLTLQQSSSTEQPVEESSSKPISPFPQTDEPSRLGGRRLSVKLRRSTSETPEDNGSKQTTPREPLSGGSVPIDEDQKDDLIVDDIAPEVDEAEKQRRKSWRKSIMLIYNAIASHRYVKPFLNPVREDEAPGYFETIRRPMDLAKIKSNIQEGKINTTAEFHRDVMLMLCNAHMYNNYYHEIYEMAEEVYAEAKEIITSFRATEANMAVNAHPLDEVDLVQNSKRSRKVENEHTGRGGSHNKRQRRI